MPGKEPAPSSVSKRSQESTLQEASSQIPPGDDTRPSLQRSQVSLGSTTGSEHVKSGPKEKEAVQDLSEKARPSEDGKDDVLVVDWEGPNDPENPKKLVVFLSMRSSLLIAMCSWPEQRKWAAALAVSSFTFISPVSSSMVAPAAFQIAQDLNITKSIEVSMTISVYILAYGEHHHSFA